jgi:hypothetical protein
MDALRQRGREDLGALRTPLLPQLVGLCNAWYSAVLLDDISEESVVELLKTRFEREGCMYTYMGEHTPSHA